MKDWQTSCQIWKCRGECKMWW